MSCFNFAWVVFLGRLADTSSTPTRVCTISSQRCKWTGSRFKCLGSFFRSVVLLPRSCFPGPLVIVLCRPWRTCTRRTRLLPTTSGSTARTVSRQHLSHSRRVACSWQDFFDVCISRVPARGGSYGFRNPSAAVQRHVSSRVRGRKAGALALTRLAAL